MHQQSHKENPLRGSPKNQALREWRKNRSLCTHGIPPPRVVPGGHRWTQCHTLLQPILSSPSRFFCWVSSPLFLWHFSSSLFLFHISFIQKAEKDSHCACVMYLLLGMTLEINLQIPLLICHFTSPPHPSQPPTPGISSQQSVDFITFFFLALSFQQLLLSFLLVLQFCCFLLICVELGIFVSLIKKKSHCCICLST